MFHPVSAKVSLPQLEEDILERWRKNNVFLRSVEARRGAKRFTLYEGPPTANGSPGLHHMLARVFKDVIPRYKVMKGYYAPRIGGWDTHGLPVELEVEKELGISSKAQIEEYGIARFNARCRESVFRYLKEWNAITERIAYWIDLDNAYVTLRDEYIETVWWTIKQMWDRGLVYQGYRVTPHCPRCGTSLSSHEVALGYKDDVPDPSIYIKFKLAKSLYSEPGFIERLRRHCGEREAEFIEWLLRMTGNGGIYLLAWTTTPWTLPGNTALAVAPDAEYTLVELDGEYIILASARREAAGLGDARVIASVRGSDLVKLRYEPLFDPREFGVPVSSMDTGDGEGQPAADFLWKKDIMPSYPVIATDFVSMEDGTGIVHIAPAYGEDDFQAGREHGLDLVHTVDLQGNVTGKYPFSGKFVKDADPLVLEELSRKGLLFRSEVVYHTYPFCWRCDAPLLYYAKQTWYIRTTAVKEGLINNNEEINWYPEHIKHGRFGDWLQNNVDWAFSRERYWGTPLPVWHCPSCHHYECIGGRDELEGKAGFSGYGDTLDLHRPFVDELTFDCPQCGGRMRRLAEVIDCWFDSGAMPVGQFHYPFDNATILEDGRFPADYICEAVDQSRGRFDSLHAISTLLFNRPCYRNVICLGHVLGARGEEMHKSKGTAVDPWSVFNKYGADALRWYLLTAAPPGNMRRFAEGQVAEVARRFLLTLWNVYSFFVTYANIDRFTPGSEEAPQNLTELDRWITSELNQLVADVDAALDGYNPTEAGRKIEAFVDALSNWYVRRSRRRFWKSESDADKLAAYNTLYRCLVTLSKLMAPLAPFLAEEIYQNLVGSAFPQAPDSVHLADFPVADMSQVDSGLAADTRLAMRISSLGRAARSKAGIKVRQPLEKARITLSSPREATGLERVKAQIVEELNIKDIEVVDDAGVMEEAGYAVSAEGGYSVAIPIQIPLSLLAEGMAREIVHRLQTMRRAAGFDITDHILTSYQGDEYVGQVMADYADYIKQETLSRQLLSQKPDEDVHQQEFKLGEHKIRLGVRKDTA